MFETAIRAGAPEVVLSGIHIGHYGQELGSGDTLAGLVRDLLARREHARIRLSSIESNEVTDDLIEMIGQGLCRHLHLPLQSGDDAILCSMKRKYSAASYGDLVRSVAAKVPDESPLALMSWWDFRGRVQRSSRTLMTLLMACRYLIFTCSAIRPIRRQVNSTALLGQILRHNAPRSQKQIGVVNVDLFVPLLTFVFGEAQLSGTAAIVSTRRLANEFYGLPRDEGLLLQRLEREIVHELGHTFGLYHCRQFECVMRSSTYVEEIDLKKSVPCPECADTIRLHVAQEGRA